VPDKLQSTAPVEKKKKDRKHSRSKKASSQPSPRKILRAENGVQEEPSDFPRHIAGRPMLTKEMLANAGGAILNLHDSIQYLEERLLQEKNPGYPVTRVNSTNVLDKGLRIGGIGRRMNSKVKVNRNKRISKVNLGVQPGLPSIWPTPSPPGPYI
jgi:hypothetical protein